MALEREQAMARRFDAKYRLGLIEQLAVGRPAISAQQQGSGAPNALGDTSADLVYTPVTPCRVFDTRLAGGVLAPGVLRSFLVAGSERFETQGGKTGGCGVPLGPATAVVLNLVAIAPTGNGNLRAWAANDPAPEPPLASVLNYASIAGMYALANGLTLPICDPAAAGATCSTDLLLQASGSSTHVVGDVLGYFRGADLKSDLLTGSSGFGPVAATDGAIHVGSTIATMPTHLVMCLITCSVTVESSAPNVVGAAEVQAAVQGVDGPAWGRGGPTMSAAPSATTMTMIGIDGGVPTRWQFGCYVAATGDYLGDPLRGAVSWVCR